MAFRSDTSGRIQLWVSDRDGKGASALDTGTMRPSVYCWSHNSDALIFAATSPPGLFEVSLSPGHTLRRISPDLSMSHPACSVDGRSVFATNRNFMYRISLQDGTSEKITDQGGAPIVQSKDGRYLYFAQGRMDSSISRLDLVTRQQQVIVSSLMPGYSDSWALTSKGIIFLKMESVPVIQFYDFDTGKEATIDAFKGGLPPVGSSGFFISPDEQTLFIVRDDSVSANIQATKL
jgi:Tol biopolymer transport system component